MTTKTLSVAGVAAECSLGWCVSGYRVTPGVWVSDNYDGDCRTEAMTGELRGMAEQRVRSALTVEQTFVDKQLRKSVTVGFSVPAPAPPPSDCDSSTQLRPAG